MDRIFINYRCVVLINAEKSFAGRKIEMRRKCNIVVESLS